MALKKSMATGAALTGAALWRSIAARRMLRLDRRHPGRRLGCVRRRGAGAAAGDRAALRAFDRHGGGHGARRHHHRDRGQAGTRGERRQRSGARGHGDRPARSDLPARAHRQPHASHAIRPARPSTSISFTGTSPITPCVPPCMRGARCLAGFTTVRNVGDQANESVALRNAINAGILPGPRIFTAGQAMGSTGGHADPTDGYRVDLAGDPGPANGVINGPEDAVKGGAPALQARRRSDQDHALRGRAG